MGGQIGAPHIASLDFHGGELPQDGLARTPYKLGAVSDGVT